MSAEETNERRVMSGPKAKELATSQSVKFNPGAFDAALARNSGAASSGDIHRTLRRRFVSLVIEPDLCRPDTFAEPFKLALMELDSDQELRALARLGRFVIPGKDNESDGDGDGDGDELPESEEATQAGQALALALAREAIYSINDRKLAPHEKPIVWEMLGMGGRLAAGTVFIAHGTGMDPDLLGKSIASVEIG